jgi:hypothetical protein
MASEAQPTMNGLNLTSTLRAETMLDDRMGHGVEQAQSSDVWLAFFGSLWAATIAYVLQEKMRLHATSWLGLFRISIEYILFTIAAGILGVWSTSVLRKSESSIGIAGLAKALGASWGFLPCAAVLYSQESAWAFVAVGLAAWVAAMRMRPLFLSLVLVLCGLGAVYCTMQEDLVLAAVLFAVGFYSFAWRWSAFDLAAVRAFTGRRANPSLGVAAVLLTVLALLPYASGHAYGYGGKGRTAPVRKGAAAERSYSDFDYVGVILYPPAEKKTEIVAPVPESLEPRFGAAAKPVVIPFDGPYWYFKAPYTEPGPRAHVLHRRSTDVAVRSTNGLPLRMEAHQNLGQTIALACCRELDVALTNADNRPGTILLGVVLTDTPAPGKPAMELAPHLIESSNVDPIPANRPPVQEVLRFPLPAHGKLRQFDAITLLFEPSRERAQLGAKVSIQNFTLVPR